MSQDQRPSQQNPYGEQPAPQGGYPPGGYPPGGQPYGQQGYQQPPYGYAQQPPPPPPRRRTSRVLIGILVVIGVCLLICVGASIFFVVRGGDIASEAAAEYTATEVANTIGTPVGAQAGTYVLRDDDLTAGLNQELASSDNTQFDEFEVTIDPTGFEVRLNTQDQDFFYRGGLTAENGRIEVTDPEAEAPFIDFFFGADDMANAVEDGINQYFEANGLEVTGVELREGEAVITTAPA